MITPQTNTDLPAIAQTLLERNDFVVCGHVSPDGDCLGSQLVVAHALRAVGKRVTCILAKDEPIDVSLSFLPGIEEMIPATSFKGPVGVFIAVDVPTVDRLGDASSLHQQAEFSVTIDHHAAPATMANLTYVDPAVAATSLLVWNMITYLGIVRDETMAMCAYTGLMTDTGRFQYQNTDAFALASAAQMVQAGAKPAFAARNVYQNRSLPSLLLEGIAIDHLSLIAGGSVALSWVSQADFNRVGATKSDAEPLIDLLRALSGVRVACMLREQDGVVRGSIRAKDDTDVSALARTFGGGGHKAAAGFTFDGSLEDALGQVSTLLNQAISHVGSCINEEGTAMKDGSGEA